jgi:hypothetical protein
MGWFSDGQSIQAASSNPGSQLTTLLYSDSDQAQSMQQFQQADNKPELSHELVAGAAAYYAADKYEEHCEANGKDYSPIDVFLSRSISGILEVRRSTDDKSLI